MKAKLKEEMVVKADHPCRDILDFVLSIDFTPLFDHVRGMLNADIKFKQPEISNVYQQHVVLNIVSECVLSYVGIVATVIDSCVVEGFQAGAHKIKETGEFTFGVSMELYFPHRGPGRTNLPIVWAEYTAKNGWTFVL